MRKVSNFGTPVPASAEVLVHSKAKEGPYLITPQQGLVSARAIAAVDVEKLGDAMLTDVVGPFLGLLPRERVSFRQKAHLERGKRRAVVVLTARGCVKAVGDAKIEAAARGVPNQRRFRWRPRPGARSTLCCPARRKKNLNCRSERRLRRSTPSRHTSSYSP